MNLSLLMIVGLLSMPAILPIFVMHIRQFVALFGLDGRRKGSPWPLITDLVAVAWCSVLWYGGLLALDIEIPEGVTITFPVVVLVGIAAGVACTLGYDGFRRFRSPSSDGK